MLFMEVVPAWLIYVIYLLCMFLRVLIPLVGTIGIARRKIQTTKIYFKSLPCQVGVTAWLLTSALRAQCSCAYDYAQCEIVVQISRDPIVNTCPKDIKAGGQVHMNPYPNVTGRRLSSYVEPKYDDMAGSTQKSGNTQDVSGASSDTPTKTKEERLREALEKTCVCRGADVLAQTPRQSCYVFVSKTHRVRSWCPIKTGYGGDDGMCAKHYLQGSEEYEEWTTDLCEQRGGVPNCECSPTPLPRPSPKEVELNPEVGRAKDYGLRCQKWHKGDTMQWCFVGYDTACAQRQWVNAWNRFKLPPDDNGGMLDLNSIAQFRSSIPCQRHLVLHAQERCLLWKITICSWMFLAEVLTLPLAAFVWIFLENRCADHVQTTVQFDVDINDLTDSDDDFDVDMDGERGERSETTSKKKRKGRGFKLEEVEMTTKVTSK